MKDWSEKLASLATQRAASCQANLSRYDAPPFHHTGWNTHIHIAPGVTSFPEVIHRWFDEGLHYAYQRGRCRENASCEHYKQVICCAKLNVDCRLSV